MVTRVVSFVFVSQHGFIHEIIGTIVKLATHSKFAHVAIAFEDCIVEAKMPKVTVSPADKYNGEAQREILSFNVSDEVYQGAYDLAKSQLCKYYGIDDCLIGGIHDLFGINIDGIDIEDTIDCSALSTEVARTLFPDLLSNYEPCEVTPETLYKALKEVP